MQFLGFSPAAQALVQRCTSGRTENAAGTGSVSQVNPLPGYAVLLTYSAAAACFGTADDYKSDCQSLFGESFDTGAGHLG